MKGEFAIVVICLTCIIAFWDVLFLPGHANKQTKPIQQTTQPTTMRTR